MLEKEMMSQNKKNNTKWGKKIKRTLLKISSKYFYPGFKKRKMKSIMKNMKSLWWN
jgi:hypothetical protein